MAGELVVSSAALREEIAAAMNHHREEAARLQRALDALNGGSPARKRSVAPRKRGAARSATGRVGRPEGRLRHAIRDALATGGLRTTAEIGDSVRRAGLTVTDSNLHQALRRLVLAGDLVRESRGVYRRP